MPQSVYLGGGGGGGTPAGNDTEVQFNDNGAFGASPGFKIADDGFGNITISLSATANGHVTIEGAAPGTEITLRGADGDTTHQTGGEATLRSGNGAADGGGGDGGQVLIQTGEGAGGGNGGSMLLQTGTASDDADSGDCDIKTGDAVGDGDSGDINIRTGPKFGSGRRGEVNIEGREALLGSDNFYFLADADGHFLGNLPTAEPVSAGYLWVDPVTRVLKVSAG